MCNTLIKAFALALTLVFASAAIGQQEANKYTAAQSEADALYDKGKFRLAYYKYRDLARRGDSFSQYRLSLMHLSGKGTGKDLLDAYAWANLAAQNKNPQLVAYRDSILEVIPENEHAAAKKKANKEMNRWGNDKLARNAYKAARRNLRSCTGSRLGTSCEAVYAAAMPKGTAIASAPGAEFNKSPATGRASGAKSAESQNNNGVESRDIEYYRDLRNTVEQLRLYIAESEGSVELGEFELIEDEEPSQP